MCSTQRGTPGDFDGALFPVYTIPFLSASNCVPSSSPLDVCGCVIPPVQADETSNSGGTTATAMAPAMGSGNAEVSEPRRNRAWPRVAVARSAKLRHFEAPVAGTARDEGEIRGLRVAETGQTKFVRRDFGEPNQWVGLAGSAAQLWFAEQSTR